MSQSHHYDALILGSGQSGNPLASHLKSLSQTVCLVERSQVGGCCVNVGCTPTKTMVASGRVAYLTRRAADYGVSTSGAEEGGAEVKVDLEKVRQRKRDIVASFRKGSERKLKNAGVDLIMGEASFTGPKAVSVKTNKGEEKHLTADKIYINVGCRPARPAIAGLDHIPPGRVLDSSSIQELGEVPEHLIVIGGGYIGLEYAQLFRRFGGKVTVIQRGPRLLARNDHPDLADCMIGILREDGIEVLLEVNSTHIATADHAKLPIKLSITTKEAERASIHASHILLATGRVPNSDSLNLSAAGVEMSSSGHIIVSPTLETSAPDIYALGDVKGGPTFTHISYDDFRLIRDNIALQGSKTEGVVKTTEQRAPYVPSVVYTDPQVAHVGPKWGDLPRGKKVVTYTMPGSWIARGLETDETRGLLKAVIDPETDQIISFSAISVEGGELMAVVQMAMLGGIKWQKLQDMVFAHPSWSEALNNLWGGEREEVTI